MTITRSGERERPLREGVRGFKIEVNSRTRRLVTHLCNELPSLIRKTARRCEPLGGYPSRLEGA